MSQVLILQTCYLDKMIYFVRNDVETMIIYDELLTLFAN